MEGDIFAASAFVHDWPDLVIFNYSLAECEEDVFLTFAGVMSSITFETGSRKFSPFFQFRSIFMIFHACLAWWSNGDRSVITSRGLVLQDIVAVSGEGERWCRATNSEKSNRFKVSNYINEDMKIWQKGRWSRINYEGTWITGKRRTLSQKNVEKGIFSITLMETCEFRALSECGSKFEIQKCCTQSNFNMGQINFGSFTYVTWYSLRYAFFEHADLNSSRPN